MIYQENSYLKALRLLSLNLFIVSIVLFLLNAMSIINVDLLVSSDIVLALGFGFGLCALFLIYQKHKVNESNFATLFFKASPYIFLVFLAIIALNQFFKWEFVTAQMARFVILAVTFGAITFWHNRDRIESEMESEKSSEDQAESKRREDFAHKFPRINRIWGIRSFVKWMYVEGWWNSSITLFLLLLGLFLLFHNLGSNSFRNDEFPTMEVASNYVNNAGFWKWDWIKNESGSITNCLSQDPWCYYPRAEIQTVLISISYKIFGISEFTTRLISAIFGFSLFLLFYYIVKYITKIKFIANIALFIITVDPAILDLSRYARMYALLMPLFLLNCFLIYTLFTKEKLFNLKNKFNFIFLSISIFTLLLINYSLHSESLLIVIPVFLFFCYQLLTEGKIRKLLYVSMATILATLLLVLSWNRLVAWDSAFSFITLFKIKNYDYINLIYSYPIGLAGLVIILSFLFKAIFARKQNKTNLFFVFISTILLFSTISLIFIINRFPHEVYSSIINPLSLICFILACSELSYLVRSKSLKIILIVFVLLFALFSLYSSADQIYGTKGYYQVNYPVAYKIVLEKYNPEKDVIFMQYSRKYYLRNLNYSNGSLYEFGEKDYSLDAQNKFKSITHDSISGWVIWDAYTEGDIGYGTLSYIRNNFLHVSGKGIDNEGVEIYYFNKTMTK